MASLSVTIKSSKKAGRKFIVEMDAERFEKLAASLGLFNPDFIESLEKSEKDWKAGRFRKIRSLKDLRK